MYIDAKYMSASMDAFEQILLAIQQTNESMGSLVNTVAEGFANLSTSASTPTKKDSDIDSASLDKLSKSVSELGASIKELNSITKTASDPSKTASSLTNLSKAIKTSNSDIFDTIPFHKKNIKYIDGIIENTEKILDISKNYQESDVKKMSTLGEFIESVSGSIFKMSGSLAASYPLLLLAAPASKLFGSVMEEISETAMIVGKRKKSIENASHSINHISLSILAFSGSIAASSLLLSTVSIDAVGSLLLLVGGIALTAYVFNEVGESGVGIVKGSLAVLVMSASLAVFSAAISFSAANLPDIENYGKLALLLGGTALIYNFVGDEMFGSIIKGSIAFGIMGLSLIALAFPISILSNTLAENPNVMWQLPLALTGLGLVFAGAGTIFEFILLGSLAFAAIGGTLWLFGKGLGAIAEAIKGYDSESINNIENAIHGVITGFGQGFSDLSLVQIAALPLTIPLVGLMGLGLISLGLGLKMYRKYAGDWTDLEADNLKYTIQSITEAYAVAGSTEGQNQLFGLHFGDNAVERGIESTMKMGKNLERLGTGIKTWLDMKLSKDDIQKLSNNVSTVLNTIPAIFASIGANQRNSSNQITLPLGVKIGIPFTDNDVELGIESTEDIGKNLKDLADGILAWKNMKLGKADLQAISNNVSTVLNTIPAIFASIGANQRNSSNQITLPLGVKIGIPFSDNDVELGIESTEKMGKNLKDLADGIFAWKEGKNGFSAKDLPAIKNNIKDILTAIPSVFAAIGKKDKESDGWFSDSDMEQGIDIISDIASPLKKMIEIVNMTKDIKNPKENMKDVGIGIATILTLTSVGLKKISEDEVDRMNDMIKPLTKLVDVLGDMNDVMKKHFDYISKLPKTYLENLKSWSTSLKNISDVSTIKLRDNLESFGYNQSVNTIQSVNTNYSQQKYNTLNKELYSKPTIDQYKPDDITKKPAINQQVQPIETSKNATIYTNNTESLEKKVDRLQKTIDTMAAAMMSLVNIAGQQNTNLQQMSLLLQSGIKIKDSKY